MSTVEWSAWAKTTWPEQPWERFRGEEGAVFAEAWRIGSSPAPGGAVSVWVVNPERQIVWAAGEKAKALKDEGYSIVQYHVIPPAPFDPTAERRAAFDPAEEIRASPVSSLEHCPATQPREDR